MPKDKSIWSSWNYLSDTAAHSGCVTYWLNRLQNLDPSTKPLFVTLNPPEDLLKQESIINRVTLAHPILDKLAFAVQSQLERIQGARGIYFTGAWCGYGFHEDGLKVSVAIAERLDCTIPWCPRSLDPKIGILERFWMKTFDYYMASSISKGCIRFVLPNGEELRYGQKSTDIISTESKPRAVVRVINMDLFRKIVFRSDTGLAEAFMDEDFEIDDIGNLMQVAVANAANLNQNEGLMGICSQIGRWILNLSKAARANTIEGSKRNIRAHYDLGNEYYK